MDEMDGEGGGGCKLVSNILVERLMDSIQGLFFNCLFGAFTHVCLDSVYSGFLCAFTCTV